MYKIKRIKIYLLLIIALMLHLTILSHIKISGALPDLMLICVVFFALFLGPAAGLESGIAAGLMKDIFALDFFGINTFILAVTGLAVGALNTKFFKDSVITQFLVVLSSVFFSMTLHFALVSFFSKSLMLNFTEYLTGAIIPAGIYSSILSAAVFPRLIDIYGLREPEEFL